MSRIINYALAVLLTCFAHCLHGQVTMKYHVVPIIENRTYELDGGSIIVTGKSREIIKINLPENTLEWYYVFRSRSNESEVANKASSIDLAGQLSHIIDKTGTTATALSLLLAPSGSGSSNVYLFGDHQNAINFLNKTDHDLLPDAEWKYFLQGSVLSCRQGKIKIDELTEGTVYLGIQAGNSPVIVDIEVVAITGELTESESSQKCRDLANIGWKAFERGDYDKCLDYSLKALKLNKEQSFVHFNLGLVYLIKGNQEEATEAYTNALAANRKDEISAKENLLGALEDLDKNMMSFKRKEDALDIKKLLKDELSSYED